MIIFGTAQYRPMAGFRHWRSPRHRVTRLDRSRKEIFHGGPDFLPDGRHFLYDRVGTVKTAMAFTSARWMQNRSNRVPSGC